MDASNLALEQLIHDAQKLMTAYIKSPTPTNLQRITDRLQEAGFEPLAAYGIYGSMDRQNASVYARYEVLVPFAHDRYLRFEKFEIQDFGSLEGQRRADLMVELEARLNEFVFEMNSFDLRTIKRMVEDPAIDPTLLRIPRKGRYPAFEKWVFDMVKRHKEMVVHLKVARGTRRRGIPELSVEGPVSDAFVRSNIFARSKTRRYLLTAFRLLESAPSKKRKERESD